MREGVYDGGMEWEFTVLEKGGICLGWRSIGGGRGVMTCMHLLRGIGRPGHKLDREYRVDGTQGSYLRPLLYTLGHSYCICASRQNIVQKPTVSNLSHSWLVKEVRICGYPTILAQRGGT